MFLMHGYGWGTFHKCTWEKDVMNDVCDKPTDPEAML
jgi:hypothetical protein